MKKTAFALGLLAMMTASGAALAGNATYGYQTGANNALEIATTGNRNYTSADQDGYWLQGSFYSRGFRNNQVIGQTGYGSTAVTDIRGRNHQLGVAQNADYSDVDVSMTGTGMRGAIYQNSSGSRISVSATGRSHTIVVRDN
ncbi:hypothetical protein [Bradyrhizobium sp. CCBAU 51627]|uniref:hypothetical protein n=1 Tax=Bradyrhizobium sp. CCBAU 51627 TaxID=1325088 RepID=UPI0023051763|nr:hypothetical protein [Bradyrhizobium sp. CCBAU 51627]MDA9434410.1 hypothetical protein [Bradyrhizobium sp. CCBAU 51627]